MPSVHVTMGKFSIFHWTTKLLGLAQNDANWLDFGFMGKINNFRSDTILSIQRGATWTICFMFYYIKNSRNGILQLSLLLHIFFFFYFHSESQFASIVDGEREAGTVNWVAAAWTCQSLRIPSAACEKMFSLKIRVEGNWNHAPPTISCLTRLQTCDYCCNVLCYRTRLNKPLTWSHSRQENLSADMLCAIHVTLLVGF